MGFSKITGVLQVGNGLVGRAIASVAVYLKDFIGYWLYFGIVIFGDGGYAPSQISCWWLGGRLRWQLYI